MMDENNENRITETPEIQQTASPMQTPQVSALPTEAPQAEQTESAEPAETMPAATEQPSPLPEPAPGGGLNGMIIGVAVLLAAAVVAVLVVLGRRKKQSALERTEQTEICGTTEPGETESVGVQAEKTELEPMSPQTVEAPQTQSVGQKAGHPKFSIGRAATIGGRSEQQDSLYCSNWTDSAVLSQRGLLVAVADGIGGMDDGSLASSTAMKAMQSCFTQNVFTTSGGNKMLSLVAAAQNDVLRLNQTGHRCGCTLVSVLIEGWNLYLASVGDSRIYLYRAGGLIVLNREHTLRRENEERMEVAREAVSPENLRKPKAITSYIGKANIRLVDRTVYPMKLLPGDKIALMSDGIFGTLSEDDMMDALRKKPEEAAEKMVAMIDARKDPRQDNATVVVIAVE